MIKIIKGESLINEQSNYVILFVQKCKTKGDKMSSSLVMRQAPEFNISAYDPKTGSYTTVSSDDYKGKWTVICFYPADFTFV